MNSLKRLLLVALFVPALSLAQGKDSRTLGDTSNDELMTHTLDAVPAKVMTAARKAAPDVYFSDAISYWEDDFRVYRVSGRLFREVWNVYVRDDGRVLRTESDTQDDR